MYKAKYLPGNEPTGDSMTSLSLACYISFIHSCIRFIFISFKFNRNHTIEREAEVRDAPLSTAEVLERTSIDHNERQQVATTSNDRIEDNKRAKGYRASQR